MLDFYQTRAGRQLIDHTLPKIADSLAAIADGNTKATAALLTAAQDFIGWYEQCWPIAVYRDDEGLLGHYLAFCQATGHRAKVRWDSEIDEVTDEPLPTTVVSLAALREAVDKHPVATAADLWSIVLKTAGVEPLKPGEPDARD